MLAFTVVASIVTGLLIGMMPAVRASGWRIGVATKDAGRGRSRSAHALQSSLVVTQVALALVLLASASLLVRSFSRLMAVDLGFSTANVITMRVDLPLAKYPELRQWTAFHDRLLESVSALPAIEHAALTTAVPLGGSGSESSVVPAGRPLPGPNDRPAGCTFMSVSGDYFAALGMPVLNGRSFNGGDREGAPLVAIIDRGLANTLFPGEEAVGKRIAFEFQGEPSNPQPVWREVIGIVPHVQYYSVSTPSSRRQVYVPHWQLPIWNRSPRRPGLVVVARTALPPETVVASVRGAAARLDPDLPVYGVSTMAAFVNQQIEQPRFTAVLVGTFSAVHCCWRRSASTACCRTRSRRARRRWGCEWHLERRLGTFGGSCCDRA